MTDDWRWERDGGQRWDEDAVDRAEQADRDSRGQLDVLDDMLDGDLWKAAGA
jgi:hypothetical protein